MFILTEVYNTKNCEAMNLFLALFTVANLFRGEHHFYSDRFCQMKVLQKALSCYWWSDYKTVIV